MLNHAVIIDCIRTPMAKSRNGGFRHVRAESLSAHLIAELLRRTPQLSPEVIDDIYWGCVQQTKEQGLNIARNAALLAGLPYTVPGVTVNRLCGSSMQALHDAARAVIVNDAECIIVGGVEHMGHIPMTTGIDIHPGLNRYISLPSSQMGITAEKLAHEYQVTRQEQDEFALRSHQRSFKATQQHFFDREIVPTVAHDAEGSLISLSTDEVIRSDASLEALSLLPTVFDTSSKGTITAGSSSAISDGAAAMLITSETFAKRYDLPIKAKIKSMSVVGCEPSIMGIGPVPATHLALKKAHLSLSDIDAIEINEAFAAQTLACLKELRLMNNIDEKVNLWGGAIALGHPLGCSGARISTTLLNVMEETGAKFGLATMCIGMGQGIATIFEMVDD